MNGSSESVYIFPRSGTKDYLTFLQLLLSSEKPQQFVAIVITTNNSCCCCCSYVGIIHQTEESRFYNLQKYFCLIFVSLLLVYLVLIREGEMVWNNVYFRGNSFCVIYLLSLVNHNVA